LSQNNNLQDELTIEESIFASDNETLKVIEAMKSIGTPRRRRNLSKSF
jgi:ATP-binding cassette subfamily F protein uup